MGGEMGCNGGFNWHRFADDFTPFMDGCMCYACKYHTKAYIHHLVRTKELLASVLLMW